MKRNTITIGIVLAFLGLSVLTSCWQEQHHEIIPPELPNYPLIGKIVSSVNGEPVSGAVVFLDTTVDTTDSTGGFYLDHIQGGKSYLLSITKANYESYSRSVTVGYDTLEVDDIPLGKIYPFVDSYNPGMWRSFSIQGLTWQGSYLWSADSMAKTIYAHNFDSYLSVAHAYKLPNYPTPKGQFFIAPLGIVFHRNYMVTYDDRRNTLYEFILTTGDTAIQQNEYTLPEEISSIGDLWDFTFDGTRLWSCCAGQYDDFHRLPVNNADDVIYRHNGDLTILNTFPIPELEGDIVNPTGITWDENWFSHEDRKRFWLNSRGNHRLYLLEWDGNSEDLDVLGYYVYDASIWSEGSNVTPYQICMGNDYIWGCFRDSWEGINSVGGPTQYIYKWPWMNTKTTHP